MCFGCRIEFFYFGVNFEERVWREKGIIIVFLVVVLEDVYNLVERGKITGEGVGKRKVRGNGVEELGVVF